MDTVKMNNYVNEIKMAVRENREIAPKAYEYAMGFVRKALKTTRDSFKKLEKDKKKLSKKKYEIQVKVFMENIKKPLSEMKEISGGHKDIVKSSEYMEVMSIIEQIKNSVL